MAAMFPPGMHQKHAYGFNVINNHSKPVVFDNVECDYNYQSPVVRIKIGLTLPDSRDIENMAFSVCSDSGVRMMMQEFQDKSLEELLTSPDPFTRIIAALVAEKCHQRQSR